MKRIFCIALLTLVLCGCGAKNEPVETKKPLDLPVQTEAAVPETTAPETTVPETTVPETTVPETTVPETTQPETKPAIRAEFKEAMDAYEAFYDEYVAILQDYKKNPADLSILGKYSQMLLKLAEMDEKFEKWENSDLNSEELKYYLEVNTRVQQKLLGLI